MNKLSATTAWLTRLAQRPLKARKITTARYDKFRDRMLAGMDRNFRKNDKYFDRYGEILDSVQTDDLNPWITKRAALAAFADEMEKISWGGTYFHGTSPAAEQSILQEGLKASKGGTGTTRAFSNVAGFGGSGPMAKFRTGLAGKFQGETAGQVSMSRSKTLAKLYGAAADPAVKKTFRQELMNAPRGRSLKAVAGRFAAAGRGLRKSFEKIVSYQPLEIQGQGLTGLRRDPSHPLLAVQKAGDVPANLIRKATPSRLGRFVTRML